MHVAKNYKLSPWSTIMTGLAITLVIPTMVGLVTGNGYWALVVFPLSVAFIFIKGLNKSKVPVGFEGVPLFLGKRIGRQALVKIDDEEIPIATGVIIREGSHWLPPLVTVQEVDARMNVESIECLDIISKDKVSVSVRSSVTYRVSNSHQSLNVGGLAEIKEGISKMVESEILEVVSNEESTSLLSDKEIKKSLKERILKKIKPHEPTYGIDVIKVDVTKVDLSERIKKALEVKRQAEILKDAGITGEALDDTIRAAMGVVVERKELKEFKENKFGFDENTVNLAFKALELIGGRRDKN